MAYIKGQWNAICDRCGFEHKSAEMKAEWSGLRVCNECYEPRHPQDFKRASPDNQTVPWTRPEGVDQFITTQIEPDDL